MSITQKYLLLKKAVLKKLPRAGMYVCKIPGLEFYRIDEAKTSENCFYKKRIILMLVARLGCARNIGITFGIARC